MVLRGMIGRPWRTSVSIFGLSLSIPVLVLGLFWFDALAYMIDVQFDRIERADAVVAFTDARPEWAVREVAALPGVLAAEGQRVVAVRLRNGARTYRLGLTGLRSEAELRVPRRSDLNPGEAPKEGILLTTDLARRLGARTGSIVTIEALERERAVVGVEVVGLVDEVLGYNAYMDIDALHRLMRESDVVSQVALRVDPAQSADVWRRLSERPRVSATSVKTVWLRLFNEKVSGVIVIVAVALTAFGLIIAGGVVYNAARIALQERAWELASLRVLGFTRGEASRILLSELACQTLIAVPLGLFAAQRMVEFLLDLRENESFRIPAVISPATFGIAALIVAAATVASGTLIYLRVKRLDLIAALKTRE